MSRYVTLAAPGTALALAVFLTGPVPAAAASCREAIVAKGSGQGLFGAGTRNAKAAAVANFEARAAVRYGRAFALYYKARDDRWDCRSGAFRVHCELTARPCK